jgi:hypothetical protein
MIRIPIFLLLLPLLLLQLHCEDILVNSFVVPHHGHQQCQTHALRQQQERMEVYALFLSSDSLDNSEGSKKDDVWFRKSGSTPRRNNDTSSAQQFNGYSVFPEDQDFAYSAFLDRSGPKWITKVKDTVQWTAKALTAATDDVNKNEDFGIAEEDDSYSDDIRRRKTRGKRALLKRALQLPWKGAKSILSLQYIPEPGTLILVRHGESSLSAFF